jgi:hypothetical protein
MPIFNGHSIVTTSGDIVLLKFIESIRYSYEDNDVIVDKLKGDVCISVRTVSGKECIVSMNEVHATTGGSTKGRDLASAIFEKWMWIHKP